MHLVLIMILIILISRNDFSIINLAKSSYYYFIVKEIKTEL